MHGCPRSSNPLTLRIVPETLNSSSLVSSPAVRFPRERGNRVQVINGLYHHFFPGALPPVEREHVEPAEAAQNDRVAGRVEGRGRKLVDGLKQRNIGRPNKRLAGDGKKMMGRPSDAGKSVD